ncbi:hypothetical protein M9H77_26374 [Catharanthus roseus]|uniref:Uncharacterized protein n=1 Tax=Catharanthus roseus TaxID=4058 RepID=A0ACC0A9Z0_CATRO|nr:hypothetical protein M9H77_26374 [Catharanthus roseus]
MESTITSLLISVRIGNTSPRFSTSRRNFSQKTRKGCEALNLGNIHIARENKDNIQYIFHTNQVEERQTFRVKIPKVDARSNTTTKQHKEVLLMVKTVGAFILNQYKINGEHSAKRHKVDISLVTILDGIAKKYHNDTIMQCWFMAEISVNSLRNHVFKGARAAKGAIVVIKVQSFLGINKDEEQPQLLHLLQ